MKLSISNIAWPIEATESMLGMIRENNFKGIEITPSRIWEDFRETTSVQRKGYSRYVEKNGLEICSMHSLFWNCADMSIFGEADAKKRTEEYFKELIFLAEDMEIPRMIIGSPSIRRRNQIPNKDAMKIAVDFFAPLAEIAYSHGTKMLIEPLSDRETDFIITHHEGIELVDQVNSKGFGLHLDAKAICSQKESVEDILSQSINKLEHFHINENGLGLIGTTGIPHRKIGSLLQRYHYDGYASIEMKTLKDSFLCVKQSLEYVRMRYLYAK